MDERNVFEFWKQKEQPSCNADNKPFPKNPPPPRPVLPSMKSSLLPPSRSHAQRARSPEPRSHAGSRSNRGSVSELAKALGPTLSHSQSMTRLANKRLSGHIVKVINHINYYPSMLMFLNY